MSEMIERVAVAIGGIDNDRCNPCEDYRIIKCDRCLEVAKRVIEAMKEPTEEMVFKFLGFKCDKKQPIYKMVIENYRNMIEAALKDD